jgi:hypothetical protein
MLENLEEMELEGLEKQEKEELEVTQKTANALYKEYRKEGGTLSFANFIQREKDKGVFPLNMKLNEEVQNAIGEHLGNKSIEEKEKKETKTEKTKDMGKDKILGLPTKTLLIAASVIVLSVVAFKIIQNRKK